MGSNYLEHSQLIGPHQIAHTVVMKYNSEPGAANTQAEDDVPLTDSPAPSWARCDHQRHGTRHWYLHLSWRVSPRYPRTSIPYTLLAFHACGDMAAAWHSEETSEILASTPSAEQSCPFA
jgi:hypothetical protein